jgi:hypothetical protein
MKILAFAILLFGCGLFIDAGLEQYSGHARAYPPRRSISLIDVHRDQKPSEFKSIMTYQWIRAALCVGAGYFLLSWVRRADSLDPLASK